MKGVKRAYLGVLIVLGGSCLGMVGASAYRLSRYIAPLELRSVLVDAKLLGCDYRQGRLWCTYRSTKSFREVYDKLKTTAGYTQMMSTCGNAPPIFIKAGHGMVPSGNEDDVTLNEGDLNIFSIPAIANRNAEFTISSAPVFFGFHP